MDKIRVKRERLLGTLRANRELHLAQYEEAMDGWREAVLDAIESELERLEDDDEKPRLRFLDSLVEPVSYEESYDKAISVMEWSEDEYVELDFSQHQEWAHDQWGWKQRSLLVNSAYSSSGN